MKPAAKPTTRVSSTPEPQPGPPPRDVDDDVSMLIKVLEETDQLLDDLTDGEVDTVTDSEGRSYLLRRAQERWRKSGADKEAAIIDALPAHLALLDTQGMIVSTNLAWRNFAAANRLGDPDHGIGLNYLTVCDAAAGDDAVLARQVSAGIRSVLSGAAKRYSCEYACNAPGANAWYQLTVTPVDGERVSGAVVMHVDLSERKRSEEELILFAAAMDTSPDGIYLVDHASMSVVQVNKAGCRMHAMPREGVLALKPWELFDADPVAIQSLYLALIASDGAAEPEETLWRRNGNAPVWIEIRRHAQCIGGRWMIVILARDVTARRDTQSRIAYLNRVHAVLSGINSLIVRVRHRDELFKEACRIAVEQGALAMTWIGMVDPALDQLTLVASAGMGGELLAAIGERLSANTITSPGDSLPTISVRDAKVFVSNDSQSDPKIRLGPVHATHGIHSFAIFPLMVCDKAVGVFVLYARERGFFHEEQLRLLTELAGDVAFAVAQIEKQERLEYLAYYDVLTGLANRALFVERVAQYQRIAAAGGHRIAVCYVDLERFKNINESLGRPAGDSLLKQAAGWLTTLAGDASIVARIDADRFGIVLPDVEDELAVVRIVEKALASFLSHSFVLDGGEYRVAAKVGVAMYPDDGADADTLLKHAEAALKKAKVGGDPYLFYAQKMTATGLGRLNLENQLRRALELNEFVLHYQPKIAVTTGRLAGAEALIRWDDPGTGLVPPARFIPILEETGLIHEVGRWALNQAMRDYLRWRDAGLPIVRIAVNLSALQLRKHDFVEEVRGILAVDPEAAAGLELEITESLIMADVQLSIAALKAIRGMGVRIAIDDFGTGFSSLSYLSKLPIDTVKIDRSFIDDMVKGPEGLSLVSIIVNLAHSLNLSVVAEGVETEEQSRLLRLLDCDVLQGFLISKPLPAAIFEARYLSGHKPSGNGASAPAH